jgi:hypothetical protein
MTITTAEQVDFLWKKVLYGVTDTSFGKAGSNETVASPTTAYSNNVWTQSSSIPSTAPTSNTAVVAVYPKATSGIHLTTDPTSPVNQSWLSNQTDFIPPTFDPSYAIQVYLGDPATTGVQAFPTSNGFEWVFDYVAGVLNFINTIPAGVSNGVYIVGCRYIGQTLDQALTGIASSSKTHVVADIAARNALTSNTGDLVHVLDAEGDPANAGPGEFADYLWTGSSYQCIATQASARTDALTSYISIDHTNFANASQLIGTVGNGTRVVEVSIEVMTAFDGSADVTIGDAAVSDRLLGADAADFGTIGNYVTNPVYQFPSAADVQVNAYFSGTPTVGAAKITITWA